jgi:hypothetical protein
MMTTPHVPPRFREDNTDGYSIADLRELNRRFDQAVDDVGHQVDDRDSLAYKSWMDHIAETVQATFDDERNA